MVKITECYIILFTLQEIEITNTFFRQKCDTEETDMDELQCSTIELLSIRLDQI